MTWSYGDKVLVHVDREEIMTRILAGESVRGIADWLKTKYPNQPRLHISYLTLQRYRDKHMHLKGEVLKEVKETARNLAAQKVDTRQAELLSKGDAYEKAKTAIATDLLQRDSLILDLKDKIFERIRLLEREQTNYKTDSVIVEYISQLRQLMVDYHKMVLDHEKMNKKQEGPTNVQVIIQQAQDQMNVLKKIVLELLQEMSPEMIPLFLDKLKTRLGEAEAATTNNTTVNIQVNNG